MRVSTFKLFAFFCFLFSGNLLSSQVPFWTEEFAGGLPANWTAIEVAGNNNISSNWVWTDTGPAGSFSIGPIASTTAANGWMLFDSDLNCSGEQDVWLVSPKLDLTDKNEVFLQFETFYRRYNDSTTVEVSVDSVNWTSVPVFVGLTNNQFGDGSASGNLNPQTLTLDLSPYGANQSSFWFAFHFLADSSTLQAGTDIGCGYSWQIDDVTLLEGDPTPPTDLRLGDFFYPPASYAQPESQIKTDTMGFSADISNVGGASVTNAVLKAEVRQGNNTIWSDSLLIPEIDTSVTDSTFIVPNLFAPDQLAIGTYNIRYTLYSLDGADATPADNTATENFQVTEILWSKEAGATTAYRPGGDPHDWVVGNLYTTSSNWVDQYQATKVTFRAVKNAADGNLAGNVVKIVLTEVNEDLVADNWGDFDTDMDYITNPGLTLRSFQDHAFTTNSTDATESENLIDFDTEQAGVILKPGNRYLLLADYQGATNNVIFHAFSEAISYFQISTVIWDSEDVTWYLGGFGPEPAAVLRMEIDLVSTADEKPLPDNSLTFYPNPASSVLNVELELEKPSLANVTIAEMSGRVLHIEEVENAQNNSLQFDVSNYPSGMYLVRVATKEGTKTKQFVVQH